VVLSEYVDGRLNAASRAFFQLRSSSIEVGNVMNIHPRLLLNSTQRLIPPRYSSLKMATMKAAQVTAWGQTPRLVTLPAPPLPAPDADEVQIKVLAAGIHRLVRSRAEGAHFSAKTLPHIPGSDGIGLTVPEGKLVYFSTFWDRGSFAQVVNVARRDVEVVDPAADPVRLAGLLNPAASSWMALRTRVSNLLKDFSVLIVGATSFSGSVALGLVRQLGAGKVMGCARNETAMRSMGYDETIVLKEDVEMTDFSKAEDVDVILDYVYGPAIVHLFKSLKPKSPVQYVHIGSLSALTIELPGALLRAKDLTLRGAAPGAYTAEALKAEMGGMVAAVAKVESLPFKVVQLDDIEAAWGDLKSRIVVKMT
jgi:NADPH:quinone reductase-like Zn-dependent oxidoreductase